MSIFGHGRLRLYLLKLLDESPRHGYEIISLLRDRFLGVYSPSPGTIYPRLARLEEEGLVTHEEVDGRKVYRLTDKGREELRNRSADLDDLERELTDSVRDIARAVKEDVRHTISSLREELKFLAGDTRRQGREQTAAGEPAGARDGEDVWGQASRDGEEEPAGRGARSRDDSWWNREWEQWERVAQGWKDWGTSWPRGQEQRPEFERTLHEFSDRVRDLVRDAGQVGSTAADNLRGILEETIEVIRRDMSHWGPPADGERDDRPSEAGERSAAGEPTDLSEPPESEASAGEESRPTEGEPNQDRGEEPGSGSGTTS